ncbi:MAG: monovalent cation/H(+) antiporter subunit G [Desulfatibacillaceae bacterium]
MLNALALLLIIAGLVFFTGGSLGIIRFPDFYSRLHAAGKMDTLGAFLSMTGLAVYNLAPFTLGSVLTSLKIVLAVAFVFLASPTATHAIAEAGVRAGLKPWIREKGKGKGA